MLEQINKKYNILKILPNEAISKADFEEEYQSFDFLYGFIAENGGKIYENGMLQFFSFQKALKWTKLVTNNYFTELKNQIFCFGITWQGCILAVDKDNQSIYLFDPATCEYFALEDTSIEKFFKYDFVEIEDEVIYPEDFRESLSYLKINNLDSDKSVGYKISLFLGGEDNFENLEIADTEVMWELQIQIAEGINETP